MRLVKIIISTVIVGFFAHSASAELLINPIGKAGMGKSEIGGFIGKSKVEYDIDFGDLGSDSGDVDRTFLSGYFAHGVSPAMDVFAVGAFLFKSDGEDVGSGDGFIFGGGARGDLNLEMSEGLKLRWYAQLLILDEDYGRDDFFDASWSAKGTELSIGAVAFKQIDTVLSVYGGIELIPFSDFKLKGSDEFGSESFDGDRDILGLRVGADYNGLLFSLGLLNETTFMFGISKPL